MNADTVRQYLDAGWSKQSLSRVDEIVALINRLPLQSKEQAEELFAIMINETMTTNEDERWTPEQQQEEEKQQWEADHPEPDEEKKEES